MIRKEKRTENNSIIFGVIPVGIAKNNSHLHVCIHMIQMSILKVFLNVTRDCNHPKRYIALYKLSS